MQEMSLLHMYYELWAIWQLSVTCHIQLSVIVVKLLWYCSYLVWLVFEGSIPTCACFQLKTFCDLFALFLFFCFEHNHTPSGKKTVYNFQICTCTHASMYTEARNQTIQVWMVKPLSEEGKHKTEHCC